MGHSVGRRAKTFLTGLVWAVVLENVFDGGNITLGRERGGKESS